MVAQALHTREGVILKAVVIACDQPPSGADLEPNLEPVDVVAAARSDVEAVTSGVALGAGGAQCVWCRVRGAACGGVAEVRKWILLVVAVMVVMVVLVISIAVVVWL